MFYFYSYLHILISFMKCKYKKKKKKKKTCKHFASLIVLLHQQKSLFGQNVTYDPFAFISKKVILTNPKSHTANIILETVNNVTVTVTTK